MKAILRSAILATTVAASLATTMMPASATTGAGVFDGTASIVCFGCGTSTGTASLTVTGTVSGHVDATYTVHEANDPDLCVVTGDASGDTTGAIVVHFNWTRVGAAAVITTTGDIAGAGVAVFAVTSPVGVPCQTAVEAHVTGALAGL